MSQLEKIKKVIKLDDEYSGAEIWETTTETIKKCPVSLQIHVVVGVILCLISFILFHYLAGLNDSISWWLWIFVFILFGMTFSFHYYFNQDKLWQGVVTSTVIFNAGAFIVWALYSHTVSNPIKPWWIFTFYVSGVILLPIYYLKVKDIRNWQALLLHIYWTTIVFLFLIWLYYYQKTFPWFLFPAIGILCPVIAYRMRYTMEIQTLWVHMLVQLTLANLLLYYLYLASPGRFLWYLIPLGVSILAILVAYLLRHRCGGNNNSNQ